MSNNIKKHRDCFILEFNINFFSRRRSRVAVRCASLAELVPLHSLCSARVFAKFFVEFSLGMCQNFVRVLERAVGQSTRTTNSRTQPPPGYPVQYPRDNYTASCDIHSTMPPFLRPIVVTDVGGCTYTIYRRNKIE